MRTRTLIQLLAFLGLFCFCGVGFFALTTTLPQASPAPWPGATVHVGKPGAVGSFGHARKTTYTSNVALEDLRHHYDQGMIRYCSEISSWRDYAQNRAACIVRDCQIRRNDEEEQYFDVRLCDGGHQQIVVVQSDM